MQDINGFAANDVSKPCSVAGFGPGVIRFVGFHVDSKEPRIGVEMKEQQGTNNGTVKGVRLFECNDGYGSLQRPKNVSCGDFPPLDDVDFSEDEI